MNTQDWSLPIKIFIHLYSGNTQIISINITTNNIHDSHSYYHSIINLNATLL